MSKSVQFQTGSMWADSVVSAVKDTPTILGRIEEFKKVKEDNPLAQFGADDKFLGASASGFKRRLPKARKAKLTKDISIVYELSGKDPTTVKLYGVFTHADLGTGQPLKPNLIKQMTTKLRNS